MIQLTETNLSALKEGNFKEGKFKGRENYFDGSGDLQTEAKELVAKSNMYQFLCGVHEKLPFPPSTHSTNCHTYVSCSLDISLCATIRMDFATPCVLAHGFEANLIINPHLLGFAEQFQCMQTKFSLE